MNPQKVFFIKSAKEFNKKAIEIFRFQAENNPVYKTYIEQIGVKPEKVKDVLQIPFLPIEFFKTQEVVTRSKEKSQKSEDKGKRMQLFHSSGTGGMERSKHYVANLSLYEKSFRKCFELFYGNVKQYAILALLPSYYENKNSSLLYMAMDLIAGSKNQHSVFFNAGDENIIQAIQTLLSKKQKVILFGVSFALMDAAEKLLKPFSDTRHLTIIETGGMKGKRKEITREALHKILCDKFGVKKVHSEYGMTELLSQAWSKGKGIFRCPPWMKALIRDANDPFRIMSDKRMTTGAAGGLNIIDLANIYSCSFIATQDAGKVYANGSFEVLGRMDNSDLRGCNLMMA